MHKLAIFVLGLALAAVPFTASAQGRKPVVVPRGEYSLLASQLWQVIGFEGHEFDIAADASGRRPVVTAMSGINGIDVFVGGQWRRLISGGISDQLKPGYMLPDGHYRLSVFQEYSGQLSGYWARPNSASTVEGDDVYLNQDRLWSFAEAFDPEFTIPATGIYLMTQVYGNALERWDGTQWVRHTIVQSERFVFAGPGIRLLPGRYRVPFFGFGWVLGYKAVEP